MDIVIDFSSIMNYVNQPMDVILWSLFWTVGWIPLGVALLWGFKELWLEYITGKWASTQKFVLLAIDIPRGNEQSPKAVENMFAYLAGAHGNPNLLEVYWEGKFQLSFSFEIVSIEGYTQFLIRTPVAFRNLVETAIYSQYPDAEITEVNDYTEGMPTKYPDDDWDVWGAEFIQVKNDAYPIKTYPEFEHQLGKPEMTFRDPMAALMDLCSSLRKGEQFWFQIIVKPIEMAEWPKKGEKEIKKMLKEEIPTPKNFLDKAGDSVLSVVGLMSDAVYGILGIAFESEEKKSEPLQYISLKPREKRQVDGITYKIGKIGYDTKLRMVYIAKKDVMNKPKVVNGFVGFIKQFAALDLNNFKPDMNKTATSTAYFFKDYRLNQRKNHIVRNYMARDGNAGRNMGILNIEELATIWHFPIESVVKAPLIQKAPGRKAEPPSSLPIGLEGVSEDLTGALSESIFEEEILNMGKTDGTEREEEDVKRIEKEEEEKGAPPSNLPFA